MLPTEEARLRRWPRHDCAPSGCAPTHAICWRPRNPHRPRPTKQRPSSPRFPPWEAFGRRPPAARPTVVQGAGVRNPRMRARKSITLLVSVNSDLSDRVHPLPTSYPVGSCDPEPRSQHPGRGVLCGGSNLQNGALMGPRVSAAPANRRPHLGQEVKAGLTPLSFLLRRE